MADAGGTGTPVPPDVVYIVGPGDEKDELRFSLRSLYANVDHGQVYVVGNRPPWLRNVEHIPVPQKGTKFANSTANVRAACACSDISDDFSLWNDDFFALVPTVTPNYHRGPITVAKKRHNPNRRKRHAAYREGIAATAWLLEQWGYAKPLNYDIHTPMMVNREAMTDVLDRAAPAGIAALHKRSVYGNVMELGGELAEDPKITLPRKVWPPGATWVSTLDRTFADGEVGRRLREMFPNPSPYEEH